MFDQHTSRILETEEWEDISRELLEILLRRSTLRYCTVLYIMQYVLYAQ